MTLLATSFWLLATGEGSVGTLSGSMFSKKLAARSQKRFWENQ